MMTPPMRLQLHLMHRLTPRPRPALHLSLRLRLGQWPVPHPHLHLVVQAAGTGRCLQVRHQQSQRPWRLPSQLQLHRQKQLRRVHQLQVPLALLLLLLPATFTQRMLALPYQLLPVLPVPLVLQRANADAMFPAAPLVLHHQQHCRRRRGVTCVLAKPPPWCRRRSCW